MARAAMDRAPWLRCGHRQGLQQPQACTRHMLPQRQRHGGEFNGCDARAGRGGFVFLLREVKKPLKSTIMHGLCSVWHVACYVRCPPPTGLTFVRLDAAWLASKTENWKLLIIVVGSAKSHDVPGQNAPSCRDFRVPHGASLILKVLRRCAWKLRMGMRCDCLWGWFCGQGPGGSTSAISTMKELRVDWLSHWVPVYSQGCCLDLFFLHFFRDLA